MANNISVVVGLDFGIIYSGFSLCYVDDDYDLSKIKTNTEWPWEEGKSKTNTALRYDDDFKKVEFWGYPALYKKPNKKSKDNETKPIELFKLHLGNCLEKFKPKLPEPLTYKRAITDYLCKIGELIKETILKYWSGIDFMEHVLLVLTVPDEYSENDIAILRECIFNAGLISDKRSERLQFTTELEAVPIYCMHSSLLAFKREHRLTEPGRIGNDKLYKETVKGGNCGLTLLHKHCTNYLNNNKCLEVKKNLKFFKSKEFKFVIIISEYSN
ncbi:hypothetical protein RhiirC2_792378 [Rhizophagus irregularis]|uniref:Hsp70 family protein n=1 Tax=Rhizophagus irregularis TaxID=588596 RepID=A0A2N1MHE6_9GLOM|nr:hypothetical protein RhiirC2_792378 [Rhizophagus irregularis]